MSFPYEALKIRKFESCATGTEEFELYDGAIRKFAISQMQGECDRWRGIQYWEKVLPELINQNPKLVAEMLSKALDRQLCEVRDPIKRH